MQRSHIIRLIERSVQPGESVWADFGSGDGAFTLALRELGGPNMELYSVDRSAARLNRQREAFVREFGLSRLHLIHADFKGSLELPELDGILMANALHFVRDKFSFLNKVPGYLKPSGKLLIVEYDIDVGNPFVPYPVSYRMLADIIQAAGFTKPELLAMVPSRYWTQIYSAVARIPASIATSKTYHEKRRHPGGSKHSSLGAERSA
jgi:ubiquinone/menaquinone biosynthesis C-methylase UbiE